MVKGTTVTSNMAGETQELVTSGEVVVAEVALPVLSDHWGATVVWVRAIIGALAHFENKERAPQTMQARSELL